MTQRKKTNNPLPVIVSMCLLMWFIPAVWAEPTLIEQIQKNFQSIVTIQAQKLPENASLHSTNVQVFEKTGAGIILDETGYIVTNTHTILDADYIYATLYNGIRLPATIASIAPDSDITLLKINSPIRLRPLPWSDSSHIALNEVIISIGNTAVWKQTICGGKITGIANNRTTGNIGLIEMNLDLDQGDSGGPVLDRQGNFLGIIIAKNMRAERSSYALPAGDIRTFYQNYLNESQLKHDR